MASELTEMQFRTSGRYFALYLILERLVARLYDGEPDELADFEAECLAAVDSLPPGMIAEENRAMAEAFSETVEMLFSGARRIIGADEDDGSI